MQRDGDGWRKKKKTKTRILPEKIMIKHFFFKQKKLYKLLFKLDANDGLAVCMGEKKKKSSLFLSAILPSSDSIRVERRITNEI